MSLKIFCQTKILSDQFDSFSMAGFWLVKHNFSVIRPNENSTNMGSREEQAGSRLTQRMDVFHSCDERIASKLNFGFVVSGQSCSLCQRQSLPNRTLYFTLVRVSLFSIGSMDAPCTISALANFCLKISLPIKTSVDQYWSKVCGVIFEISRKISNTYITTSP